MMSLSLSSTTSERTQASPPTAEVSVIVPFWNEGGNLEPLADELRAALEGQHRAWEVLLVDDGSTDGCRDEARAIAGGDDRFRVVALRRHAGKSAALAAGRDRSCGAVLVTIDADLQDPPAAIPAFLDAIDEGHDVVAAWRIGRREPLYRRMASAIFNWMLMLGTGVPIHDMNAGLKAYRRSALESIHLSRGMHRFLAIFAHGRGFDVTELPVEHRPRHSGRTKYGIWRYAETIVGLVTVVVLREGPDAAMRQLVRIAGVVAPVGLVLTIVGGLASSMLALAIGVVMLMVAFQLLIGRMLAEILFQLVATGSAPPPYVLVEEPERDSSGAS